MIELTNLLPIRFPNQLTTSQINKLSDISADIAQVFLASVALPYIIDIFRPMLAVFGIALAVGFWIISVQLLTLRP